MGVSDHMGHRRGVRTLYRAGVVFGAKIMTDTQNDSAEVLALAERAGIYWVSDNTAYAHPGMLTEFLRLGTEQLERERDDAIAAHAGVLLGSKLAQEMSDRRVDELEATIERLQDSHRRRVQKESDAAWDRGEKL